MVKVRVLVYGAIPSWNIMHEPVVVNLFVEDASQATLVGIRNWPFIVIVNRIVERRLRRV